MFRTSQAFFALPAEVKGRYGFDQVCLACFCIKRIALCTCVLHRACAAMTMETALAPAPKHQA